MVSTQHSWKYDRQHGFIFRRFSGWTFQKYSSCHHLAIFRGVGKNFPTTTNSWIFPQSSGWKFPKNIRNLPPPPSYTCYTINHLAIFPGRGAKKYWKPPPRNECWCSGFSQHDNGFLSPLTVPTNIKYQVPCGWVKANQENCLVNRGGSMEPPCVGILRKTGEYQSGHSKKKLSFQKKNTKLYLNDDCSNCHLHLQFCCSFLFAREPAWGDEAVVSRLAGPRTTFGDPLRQRLGFFH